LTDVELFAFKGTWHVRHANGTEENIVLEHGNLVEDSRGTAGQFILERILKGDMTYRQRLYDANEGLKLFVEWLEADPGNLVWFEHHHPDLIRRLRELVFPKPTGDAGCSYKWKDGARD
jgi:hypothetical protein